MATDKKDETPALPEGAEGTATPPEPAEKPVCGLVMPISTIEGVGTADHWAEVLEILKDAVESAGFAANLVSNAEPVGTILKRIVQNLYDNPIVICDVSGKNANVMFELGLRLAFDKPTIIVKDDLTSYSFDTSTIEHLEYPRDLRFKRIVAFKQTLAAKIRATHKAAADPNFTTFLKNFGEFTVAKIEKKEVSGERFIIDRLEQIGAAVARLEPGGQDAGGGAGTEGASISGATIFSLDGVSAERITQAYMKLVNSSAVEQVWVKPTALGTDGLHVKWKSNARYMDRHYLKGEIERILGPDQR